LPYWVRLVYINDYYQCMLVRNVLMLPKLGGNQYAI
jgi:hypothetical protein